MQQGQHVSMPGGRAAMAPRTGPARAGREMRVRLGLTMSLFAVGFALVGLRLMMLAMTPSEATASYYSAERALAATRPQIFDRNGELLATDIKTASLYAEPRAIIDADLATEKLTSLFPDLDARRLRRDLSSGRAFVFVKRELTPRQRDAAHNLGIPGIGFVPEKRRIYPSGSTASHVLGQVNVDHEGLTGIELYLDRNGLKELHELGFAASGDHEPVSLALDLKVQHSLRDELAGAIEKYKAQAAAGIVIHARTGEVVAMSSLPDFDPNDGAQVLQDERMNRVVTGVYELGSIVKAFTVAMALDTGVATLESRYDARQPIRAGGFTISDHRPQRRILTVPEVFTYSSNIASARMALDVGTERHREFLGRLGLLHRVRTELPESAAPLVPATWRDISTMTIAFGHGFSVTPLQAASAAAALFNGGLLVPPTMLKRSEEEAMALAKPVLKPQTSAAMRYLMRLNAQSGTGRQADAPGYRVGGKTGTAEKIVDGRYAKGKLLTTFLAAFPMDDPQYVVLLMLDEPQGIKETHGYATSGWNVAPVTGRLIQRIAPMLGVAPRFEGSLAGVFTAE